MTTTTRVLLTDDGAKARAFVKMQGLDFDVWKDACVHTLSKAVVEHPVEPRGFVDVDASFVQVCLDRDIEPGALLSSFMCDVLDGLKPDPTADPGVAAQSEGTTEDV